MSDYGLAQGALVASAVVGVTGFATAAYTSTVSFITAAADPSSSSLESLLPQLGIFTIVIVVFKFMLGRQDARDTLSDNKDKQTLDSLRTDIEALRHDQALERAQHAKELADERAAHDATRQKLIDLLLRGGK